jgi:rhodanese-related sulfurtransferase
MSATMTAPKISAVDYFAAKLAYEMTPYSLNAALEKKVDLVVLDARSAEDYAAGHIPGALSVPLLDLPKKMSTLPKGKTIVAYCGNITCSLAPKAALALAEAGFTVKELFGGFATWKEKGFPVQK